jgi:hypothetical protein
MSGAVQPGCIAGRTPRPPRPRTARVAAYLAQQIFSAPEIRYEKDRINVPAVTPQMLTTTESRLVQGETR